MDEDIELIDSPLSRKVTRDGITVEISIYRSSAENDWVLEVVDQNGGSTVWEDRFSTDQAALDEAMSAIETDGIASFAQAPSIEFPQL